MPAKLFGGERFPVASLSKRQASCISGSFDPYGMWSAWCKRSANGKFVVWVGGLDSCDPPMKGIVT